MSDSFDPLTDTILNFALLAQEKGNDMLCCMLMILYAGIKKGKGPEMLQLLIDHAQEWYESPKKPESD